MRKILLLILCFIVGINSLYAADSGSVSSEKETIKEMQTDVEGLDKAKAELITSKEFAITNTISSFFRKDLTKEELNTISSIVKEYNKSKEIFEIKIIEASKNQLDTTELSKKLSILTKEFYEGLLDFINIDQYSNYIYYIGQERNFYIEEKELDALIVKKTELINKRLTSIEEKIKEHNEQQENVLKQAVYLEVDKKMDSLQEKDYFQRFDSKEKATFINQVIINIEKKKNELIYQNESGRTAKGLVVNFEKKVKIYNFMNQRFEEFRKGFEE